MSTIKVEAIELLFYKFFKKIKEQGIEKFSFDEDFYWNVPIDSLDEFPNPPALTVGSISDDISFLNSLVEEDYDSDYLELERLSALLKKIKINLSQVNREGDNVPK